jgi:Leucine-rich repeat (LRR) protein
VILAQLFNATGGQDGSWIRSDGWQELINDVAHAYGDVATSSTNSSSFSVSLCKLYGVLCNSQGQVSMITLSKNGLGGTLPPSLFQLPHLTSLDVSENLIEVEDWTALEAATVLTHLKVSRTRISTLEGVSRATQLAELSAGGNSFHSGVLPELFEMANLVDLRLEASFLTGTIPSELNRLTNLKKLHLHENQLHGELPASLASLSQLEELDLSSNSLNGTLPIEWNSFSRLVTLRINGKNREREG